jgi:ribosome biogenesis GTPase
MIGKIIKQISNDYTVKLEDRIVICKARGKFRNMGITPLVGDNVVVDMDNNYIMEILDRKNELERPSISNIDQAVIVTSVKIPDFSSKALISLVTDTMDSCTASVNLLIFLLLRSIILGEICLLFFKSFRTSIISLSV